MHNILLYQSKDHNVRQIRFYVCTKMRRCKRRVCKRKTLFGQPIYMFAKISCNFYIYFYLLLRISYKLYQVLKCFVSRTRYTHEGSLFLNVNFLSVQILSRATVSRENARTGRIGHFLLTRYLLFLLLSSYLSISRTSFTASYFCGVVRDFCVKFETERCYPGQVRSIGRISRIGTRFRNIFTKVLRCCEWRESRYIENVALSPAATNSVTRTCMVLQLLPVLHWPRINFFTIEPASGSSTGSTLLTRKFRTRRTKPLSTLSNRIFLLAMNAIT